MDIDRIICSENFLKWAISACVILLALSEMVNYAVSEGCVKRGGEMVSDGDATYIVVGAIAMPLESEKCSLQDGDL